MIFSPASYLLHSATSSSRCVTCAVSFLIRSAFIIEGDKAWGLGIAIIPTIYGTIYEHGGNNGDFQSGFKYMKARKTRYVFFTNCDKGSVFNKNLTALMMGH